MAKNILGNFMNLERSYSKENFKHLCISVFPNKTFVLNSPNKMKKIVDWVI